jgi:MFS family permease
MTATPSPFDIPNVRRFIRFRIFFNARFYYPVFAVLFLDFGLAVDQFAILNVAWAVSIVLLEIPSGALADTIGRRNLLVAAGILMVIEIAILAFAPRGNPGLLFGLFLANRILSGTAEAAASGADEALAYDSLARYGNAKDWSRVLERQMRLQAGAFVLAMSIGAAVYDPNLLTRLAGWLGSDIVFTRDMTLRYPVYLTFGMSLCALYTVLRMREVPADGESGLDSGPGSGASTAEAFRLTLRAGRWILDTPFALIVILAGLLFDHVIRMLLTLNSQYFRMIQLPEASFGLIGSGMAVLGLFVPGLARRLAEGRSPAFNMAILSVLTLAGLWGMTFFVPYYGLVPMLFLYAVMQMTHFFASHYLNRIAPSRRRATILSFKGLSYNLGYGLIGLLYSGLVHLLRGSVAADRPDLAESALENIVFRRSVEWFPAYYLAALTLLVGYAALKLRGGRRHLRAG